MREKTAKNWAWNDFEANLGRTSFFTESPLDPSHPAPPLMATLRELPSAQAALSVNAHAVLARCCTLKSPERSSAPLASAANSCASCWLADVNAHAVLESS